MTKENKLFTIRRNKEWDEMLSFLSQKLLLDKSSTLRFALVKLYDEYSENKGKEV